LGPAVRSSTQSCCGESGGVWAGHVVRPSRPAAGAQPPEQRLGWHERDARHRHLRDGIPRGAGALPPARELLPHAVSSPDKVGGSDLGHCASARTRVLLVTSRKESAMKPSTATRPATTPSTPAPWLALHTRRWRSWRDRDLFSGREAYLRRLDQAGHLGP
jgi:hypothetical protein